MVSSVSINVTNAWNNRDSLGIDQSKDTVDPLFSQSGTTAPDVTGLTTEQVDAQIALTQAEINKLKESKEKTDKQIEKLQKEIAELQEEITNDITKAINDAKEYTEQQQEAIKKATEEVLAEYTASNGAMTEEEMQAKLADKLGSIDVNLPASITSLLSNASAKLDQLMAKSQLLSNLMTISQCFDRQIQGKENQVADLNCKKEEIKKQEEERKKCDPIGFVVDGKICDFIIDRNGDNKFNNETEFLGAKNNWQEMVSLDQNGNNDGIVSREEMEHAGVKVLVTNPDGTQEIVSLADLGVDEIDLSSYQGADETIGNSNNQVLGTFGITVNGKNLNDGYNTLDTIDWLDKNYSNMFTDKAERKNRFATENGLAPSNSNYNISESMLNIFTLRDKINEATSSIKSDFDALKELKEAALKTKAPEKKEEKEPA